MRFDESWTIPAVARAARQIALTYVVIGSSNLQDNAEAIDKCNHRHASSNSGIRLFREVTPTGLRWVLRLYFYETSKTLAPRDAQLTLEWLDAVFGHCKVFLHGSERESAEGKTFWCYRLPIAEDWDTPLSQGTEEGWLSWGEILKGLEEA